MKRLPKIYSYGIFALGVICIGISLNESRTFIDLLFTLLGSGFLIWGTYIFANPGELDPRSNVAMAVHGGDIIEKIVRSITGIQKPVEPKPPEPVILEDNISSLGSYAQENPKTIGVAA